MQNSSRSNYPNTGPSTTFFVVNLRSGNKQRVWRPPTDVYESQDFLTVRIEVAGMKDGDFSINIANNQLTVSGTRSETPERRAFHQMEIPFGEFEIQVEIPVPIEIDQVKAEYQHGFLKIIMPKAQVRHIKINEE